MRASRLARVMHRVHRFTGSVLSLLMLSWFASGAVMTFSGYPRVTDAERLASAAPLPGDAVVRTPQEVLAALRAGADARLAMHEQAPTWLFTDARGERIALRARAPQSVARLDDARARAEVARHTPAPIVEITLRTEPDQWTVARAKPGTLPFYRVRLDDAQGRELYLSARTGEIVQDSTESERALAWIGAIPHWIYPTALRREPALWKQTVLGLSAAGLAITLSGMIAGIHVHRATRRRKAPRDPYLRWHQALGLGFGLLATTWVFSGALSLNPFRWANDGGPEEIPASPPSGVALPVEGALRSCQRALEVRELSLRVLGDGVYVVCFAGDARTRVVDLADPGLLARTQLAPERLAALASRAAAGRAHTLAVARTYDAYHYPTHGDPDAALPFVRIDVQDEHASSYYVDPARAALIRRHGRRTRLERWLYSGLHSLDIPGLYERRVLWRTLVIAAMVAGSGLSALGFAMHVRRFWRGQRSKARKRRRAGAERAISRSHP